jgi:hypothetical protein
MDGEAATPAVASKKRSSIVSEPENSLCQRTGGTPSAASLRAGKTRQPPALRRPSDCTPAQKTSAIAGDLAVTELVQQWHGVKPPPAARCQPRVSEQNPPQQPPISTSQSGSAVNLAPIRVTLKRRGTPKESSLPTPGVSRPPRELPPSSGEGQAPTAAAAKQGNLPTTTSQGVSTR